MIFRFTRLSLFSYKLSCYSNISMLRADSFLSHCFFSISIGRLFARLIFAISGLSFWIPFSFLANLSLFLQFNNLNSYSAVRLLGVAFELKQDRCVMAIDWSISEFSWSFYNFEARPYGEIRQAPFLPPEIFDSWDLPVLHPFISGV